MMNPWKIGLPLVGVAALVALLISWNREDEAVIEAAAPQATQTEIKPTEQPQPNYEQGNAGQPIIIQQPSGGSALGDLATGALIGHALSGGSRQPQQQVVREIHHYPNAATKKPAVTLPKPIITKPSIKPSFAKTPVIRKSYGSSYRSTYRPSYRRR